jgi:hypothetical protein
VIHCKCCNNNLSQTQATASPVKHMLEQPWGLAVRKWEHHFITVYSHSLKYDNLGYDQPKLQPKFP